MKCPMCGDENCSENLRGAQRIESANQRYLGADNPESHESAGRLESVGISNPARYGTILGPDGLPQFPLWERIYQRHLKDGVLIGEALEREFIDAVEAAKLA